MKKRSPAVYLNDIIESANYITLYLDKIAEEDFYKDVEKQDAVLRRLEIIGEAVKHLPDRIRENNPEIPWRQMAGMRDVIIHEYFGVTLNMIWIVATVDIPALIPKIKRIIEQEN